MSKVTITGWTKGCDTVAAIKLIREKALMPLNEALGLVNQVLGGEEVFIQVSDPDSAQMLINSLKEVGMIAISPDDKNSDSPDDKNSD